MATPPLYAIDSNICFALWKRIEFNEPVDNGNISGSFYDPIYDSWMVKAEAWAPPHECHSLDWVLSKRELPLWVNTAVPRFSCDNRWAIELNRTLIHMGATVKVKEKSDGSMRISVKHVETNRYGVFTRWSDSQYPADFSFVLSMATFHMLNGPQQLGKLEQAIRTA